MRYKGRKLTGPRREVLVIPRPSTMEVLEAGKDPVEIINDIPFIAEAVMDFTEFEQMCPPPVPPNRLVPGDPPRQLPNPEDQDYKLAIHAWSAQKTTYMILKSLSATPNLEWENVNLGQPETYPLYPKELEEAGFNPSEVNLIVGLALKVNSIDEAQMEEARKRFLASQAAAAKS